MTLIQHLRTKIDAWKEKRFLKKHDCETREEYERRYDPDCNKCATRLKDFYQGYKFVHCFENFKHEVYHWDIAVDGIYVMTLWCKEHFKGKFRFDIHRAINFPSTGNQWVMNDIGGIDYIFFACQDPEDYFVFKLQWGN